MAAWCHCETPRQPHGSYLVRWDSLRRLSCRVFVAARGSLAVCQMHACRVGCARHQRGSSALAARAPTMANWHLTDTKPVASDAMCQMQGRGVRCRQLRRGCHAMWGGALGVGNTEEAVHLVLSGLHLLLCCRPQRNCHLHRTIHLLLVVSEAVCGTTEARQLSRLGQLGKIRQRVQGVSVVPGLDADLRKQSSCNGAALVVWGRDLFSTRCAPCSTPRAAHCHRHRETNRFDIAL